MTNDYAPLLTVEITSALVHQNGRNLVEMRRDWSCDDRWQVQVDIGLTASTVIAARLVDGYAQAQQVAGEMAADVLAYHQRIDQARDEMQAKWPRQYGSRTDASGESAA